MICRFKRGSCLCGTVIVVCKWRMMKRFPRAQTLRRLHMSCRCVVRVERVQASHTTMPSHMITSISSNKSYFSPKTRFTSLCRKLCRLISTHCDKRVPSCWHTSKLFFATLDTFRKFNVDKVMIIATACLFRSQRVSLLRLIHFSTIDGPQPYFNICVWKNNIDRSYVNCNRWVDCQ